MLLFSKTCALCNTVLQNPLARVVPVVGYTTGQKRYFCSEQHANDFERGMRKALKNHVPGCRTCFG